MDVAADVIRGVEAELVRLQRENEALHKAAKKAYGWLREDTPVVVDDILQFDRLHSDVVETLRAALAAAATDEQEAG